MAIFSYMLLPKDLMYEISNLLSNLGGVYGADLKPQQQTPKGNCSQFFISIVVPDISLALCCPGYTVPLGPKCFSCASPFRLPQPHSQHGYTFTAQSSCGEWTVSNSQLPNAINTHSRHSFPQNSILQGSCLLLLAVPEWIT